MSLAYLNGEFLPLEKAKISPLDRGFLFGDGVYEVIPFYNGIGLGLDLHLERLSNSLDAIGIPSALDPNEWKDIFKSLLEGSTGNKAMYLQVTRGSSEERTFFYPGPTVKPSIFAFTKELNSGALNQGVEAITLEDTRWANCYIKSINLLPSCIASNTAHLKQANEAILFRHGQVTEGASSNVFVLKDGHVLTTPVSSHILNGITRQLTLNILEEQKIPHEQIDISLETLAAADEIWITSSTREIAPVIKLDGTSISDGKPGPIWEMVYEQYSKLIGTTLWQTEMKRILKKKNHFLNSHVISPLKSWAKRMKI